MTAASFSLPDDRRQRVSIRRRSSSTSTETASAADEALRHVLDRRLRKREGRLPPPRLHSSLGGPSAAIAASVNRLGWPQWLFRAGVLGAIMAGLAYSMITFRHVGTPVPLHPVSASVTVGRAVPIGARVILHPRSGPLPGDAMPQGTVAEDGSVTFVTYPPLPGVPAGDYVATLQWFQVGADGSVGGNVVPARYASAAQSPLTIKVTGDDANRHDLKVQAK